MSSLISDADKADLESVFEDLHDTFAVEIFVLRKGNRIILSSDASHDIFFTNQESGAETTVVTEKFSIMARKVHEPSTNNSMKRDSIEDQSQVPLKTWRDGTVRLRVRASDYEMLKSAEEVEINGARYKIDTDFSPHGLFSDKFYDAVFKRNL